MLMELYLKNRLKREKDRLIKSQRHIDNNSIQENLPIHESATKRKKKKKLRQKPEAIETYINERHEVLEEFKEPEFVNESKYIK